MSLYLTRTEKNEQTNWRTNIRPIFEVKKGKEIYLLEPDKNLFLPLGVIEVSNWSNEDSPLLQDATYYILNLEDYVYHSLYQKNTGIKVIKDKDFVRYARGLEREGNISEVITIANDYDFDKILEWCDDLSLFSPITKKIYLHNNNLVVGPFTYQKNENKIGYELKPANTLGDNAYLINVYDLEDPKEKLHIYDFPASEYIPRQILYGTEETLPKPIKQIDFISDKDLKFLVGRILSQSLETKTKKEKQEIKNYISNLPETDISIKRKLRIEDLFKKSENIDNFMSYIPSLILEDDKSAEKIAEAIFENENYKNDGRLTNYVKNLSGFNTELESVSKEIKKLDEEIARKQEQLDELSKKGTSNISEKVKNELDTKIALLRKDNDVLQEKIEKYESLHTSIKDLTEKEKKLKNRLDVRKNDIYELGSQVKETIKSAYKDLFEHNFDGELANIIIHEASKYENMKQNEALSENLKISKENIEMSTKEDLQDFINFIHNELEIEANRDIERNDIVNILLCLSQGFITIFAGEPGTGKTSLVNLIAKVLGLSNETCNRYVEVPVEKGWTSRRDFIGYYNPLNKSFEATNKNLLKALYILNYEAEHNDMSLPYLILLDEANLSQMEYYWADFMGLCDLDKPNRTLTLSEDIQIKIPYTLKFVATINLDHTTEALSPRLIDRAWIVTLKSPDIDIEYFEESAINKEYPMISMNIFKPLYDSSLWESDKLDDGILDKFKKIYDCFKNINIHFSPRIIGMIKRYCLAGKKYFDNKNNYVALDYAVAQKILPKINGYGEDYREFIDKLLKECDDNSMPMCNSILNDILKKGDSNMQYYQFFAR